MTSYWFYPVEDQEDYKVTTYIFDSHRPFHHNNINDDSKRIHCVDDGCKSFTECPTAQDMHEYIELTRQDDGSDDDEDDDEDDSSNSDADNG